MSEDLERLQKAMQACGISTTMDMCCSCVSSPKECSEADHVLPAPTPVLLDRAETALRSLKPADARYTVRFRLDWRRTSTSWNAMWQYWHGIMSIYPLLGEGEAEDEQTARIRAAADALETARKQGLIGGSEKEKA